MRTLQWAYDHAHAGKFDYYEAWLEVVPPTTFLKSTALVQRIILSFMRGSDHTLRRLGVFPDDESNEDLTRFYRCLRTQLHCLIGVRPNIMVNYSNGHGVVSLNELTSFKESSSWSTVDDDDQSSCGRL